MWTMRVRFVLPHSAQLDLWVSQDRYVLRAWTLSLPGTHLRPSMHANLLMRVYSVKRMPEGGMEDGSQADLPISRPQQTNDGSRLDA